MSVLHPSAKSREALRDHLFYGGSTVALLVLGLATSAVVWILIPSGVIR